MMLSPEIDPRVIDLIRSVVTGIVQAAEEEVKGAVVVPKVTVAQQRDAEEVLVRLAYESPERQDTTDASGNPAHYFTIGVDGFDDASGNWVLG